MSNFPSIPMTTEETIEFNMWLEEHDKQIRADVVSEVVADALLKSADVQQIRADAIEEYKYNVVLFREIFLYELERQAVDREEIIMYRNICSMAWKKYLEQLKEQK